MSCEHLIVNDFPIGSKEAVQPAIILQNLANTCRRGQSRITHTSKILNAEDDALMDSIWKTNKQEAEEYLATLSLKQTYSKSASSN